MSIRVAMLFALGLAFCQFLSRVVFISKTNFNGSNAKAKSITPLISEGK
jgi:hypothetical protein